MGDDTRQPIWKRKEREVEMRVWERERDTKSERNEQHTWGQWTIQTEFVFWCIYSLSLLIFYLVKSFDCSHAVVLL